MLLSDFPTKERFKYWLSIKDNIYNKVIETFLQ